VTIDAVPIMSLIVALPVMVSFGLKLLRIIL